MARLRNVRQLGFTAVTYPGAVHTRFEHTIGTCEALSRLMEQFGGTQKDLRDRLMMAAIVSEIGIFPLSYSGRAVFKKYGMDKKEYGRLLFDSFIKSQVGFDYTECRRADEDAATQAWWSPVRNCASFSYLTPVKLASTIDYVLRDGYYTGRQMGTFDYRYFSSLHANIWEDGRITLRESLYSLHRAAHALNVTYGDPLRRLLTQALIVLTDKLTEVHELDLGVTKDPNVYVVYDDSTFLYELSSAVRRAKKYSAGLQAILDMVLQRTIPTVEKSNLPKGASKHRCEKLRLQIAKQRKIHPWQVFFLDYGGDENVGFRLFGTDFTSYNKAINSRLFKNCTALNPRLDAVLQESMNVEFVAVGSHN